jgi:hypothetical protein
MPMTTELLERPALSKRLKLETNDEHERMHRLMEQRASSPRSICSRAMSSTCSMIRPCAQPCPIWTAVAAGWPRWTI